MCTLPVGRLAMAAQGTRWPTDSVLVSPSPFPFALHLHSLISASSSPGPSHPLIGGSPRGAIPAPFTPSPYPPHRVLLCLRWGWGDGWARSSPEHLPPSLPRGADKQCSVSSARRTTLRRFLVLRRPCCKSGLRQGACLCHGCRGTGGVPTKGVLKAQA